MRSPFPGMDPFIEACGRREDFHSKLIGAIEQTLAVRVPGNYLVGIGERYYVVIAAGREEREHDAGSDVGVRTHHRAWAPAHHSGATGTASAAATEAPVTMRAFIEEHFRETFIEIRQVEGDRLVTVIEVTVSDQQAPRQRGLEALRAKTAGLLRR